MSKKVLITGTSSGFGKLIANTLLGNGHQVVASMRDIEGRNKAAADMLTLKTQPGVPRQGSRPHRGLLSRL